MSMQHTALHTGRVSRYSKWDVNKKGLKKYWTLYLLSAIPLLVIFVYNYLPMVGIFMAFKDYKITRGFMGIFTSPNVGLENFYRLFRGFSFPKVVANTFIISLLKMIFTFPTPIIFALMLNEVTNRLFKRFTQTVSYLPNFFSMVIVFGIMQAVISPTYGIINMVRQSIGLDTKAFLVDPTYFRSILVTMDIWQGTGWGAIIYLAAIAGVDQEMYEAAVIDGATRFQRIWHITIPSITGIISFLFVLRCGGLLSVSFEQVLLLYSPTVYSVGDVISTYAYRKGLEDMQYGFSTAVGLFNSVVSLALVIISNAVAKKFGQGGLW